MKLHIVIASTRPGRVGPRIAEWFASQVDPDLGFEVEIVDLARLGLPLLDDPHHPFEQRYLHEHTRTWSGRAEPGPHAGWGRSQGASVSAADAFVLVMPEYNVGFTAPLKNALDYLYCEWHHKPVGFVSSWPNSECWPRSWPPYGRPPPALITMLPGPDTAMVLATAVKAGRAAAVRAALGVGSGLLIWGAAAAAGLAAALRSSAVLYDGFRLTCAAYLVFLAVQAIRASHRPDPGPDSDPDPAPGPATGRFGRLPSFGWGYRRALLTCALNPKLGVFFVVVLPQFIPGGAAVGPTSMALAALHAGEAVLWYLLLGALAGTASHVLARRRVRVWLDRVTAAVFLGFGARLAAETGS